VSAAEDKTKARVAIVDDDEESTLILQEFLESRGLSAERFLAAEALLAATPCRFAAILLDINLPGMWGSECGFELRRRGYSGPIIAISGNIEIWDPGDLRDLGFTCALGKPVEPRQLLGLLRTHIKRNGEASSGKGKAMPPLDPQPTVSAK
jgi:DNA-binding response OmpR family regulator